MHHRRPLPVIALSVALVLACGAPSPPSASPASTTGASTTPGALVDWRDATQAPDDRVAALLAEMTSDEKIGQMTQLEVNSVTPAGVTDLLLGSVLSGGGGAPVQNDPGGWFRMVDGFQQAALATRLGIPMLYGIDAVHGHNNVVGATIFPHNIGLGAADDPDLVERIGRATAEEMRATGIRWNFGPVVAVPQDVRWGRTYEGFGEDAALVGTLGRAMIRGLQGDDLTSAGSVAATAKHFVGDGGTGWGTSTTGSYAIDQGVTDVDESTLRSIHLAPYVEAIEEGARIVMASFSSTGAGKVHGDHHLLTEVLKGELGFTGFVVSDWGGVDQVTSDYTAAVAAAISAGIDMVMIPSDGPRFQDAVRAGLESGAIAQERVDDAVRRILRVKFELGLFEAPMPTSDASVVGSAAHRALGREAAARSVVLLETMPSALPLDPGSSLLLAGSGADDIGRQSGGWTISWQGSDGAITPGTTIAAAIAERIGEEGIVRWRPGDAAPAERLPVGLVVVSEPPYAEGVGDSATLELPAEDLQAIDAVRPLVDSLVVVILSGRPVLLDEVLPTADAVVAAWLPGTEGAGVVDVLYGDQPFSGTTPFTWPRTPDDAPRTGKDVCDGAVFPRGYGLTAAGDLLGPAGCEAR